MGRIYKILSRAEWAKAQAAGVFEGSAVDHADGFIHFSTAAQAAEVLRRAGSPNPYVRMPPLGSIQIDPQGLAMLAHHFNQENRP